MKRYIIPIFAFLCTLAMGATLTQNVTLNNFNSGELSPLMNSRVDFPNYRTGAKTLQNMLVRAQGPITRRPGTKYISAVKDATDDTRIIPFHDDSNDYIVEIGDGYARFFTEGAIIADVNGATHYEIDTPWDANDVFELQYATAEGVMRIVHEDYEPYKLYRPDDTNDANWVCEAIGTETGPFRDENTDKTWTLTADSNIGDVNLTSTDALFQTTHVGALWQISHVIDGNGFGFDFWSNTYPSGTEETGTVKVWKYQYYDVITNSDWKGTIKIQRSYDDGSTWENVYTFSNQYWNALQYAGREMEETCLYRLQMVGQYVTSHNFRHYEKQCAGTFNTRPMTYNGVVEITSVTNTTTAVASVKTELASTAATWRWAEGSWSDYRGWPKTVECHEQRILYGGNKSEPETIWSSIIATKDSEYDEFTANTESDITGNLGGPDDLAWTYKFPGLGSVKWLKSGKFVLVGTDKGVAALGQPGRPLTPNYPPIMRMQNYNACASLQPAEASNAILYVEKGLEKIRELEYTYSSDKYESPDLTVLAEHITEGGIVDLAFQSRPEPILWVVRSDGALLSFTYMRNQGIGAWGEHVTGDTDNFVSIARVPSDDEDNLWTLVDRTVNSASVKYVELFQPIQWDKVSSPYDQNDCWFVDCGTTSGWDALDHLEGETVYGYADGRPLGSYAVTGGVIAPAGTFTNKLAGLAYTSIYETMPIVLLDKDEPVMAEYTNIKDFRLKFYRSLGAHVGYDGSNLVDLAFSSDSFATTLDVVTDYKTGPFVFGMKRSPTIYITETDPIPLTIEAIHLSASVSYD